MTYFFRDIFVSKPFFILKIKWIQLQSKKNLSRKETNKNATEHFETVTEGICAVSLHCI